MPTYDVVADFWDWYQRRRVRQAPVAALALDKCEETFRRCEWDSFDHWYRIYLRERSKVSTRPDCAARERLIDPE